MSRDRVGFGVTKAAHREESERPGGKGLVGSSAGAILQAMGKVGAA